MNNGLLKQRLRRHNVVHDVNNEISSRDSNEIVDVVMWPKFGNFYERSDHNLNFIKI